MHLLQGYQVWTPDMKYKKTSIITGSQFKYREMIMYNR